MGQHAFPASSLLPVLLVTWGVIIAVFLALHWWWMSRNTERQARTAMLMQLPFAARDQRAHAVSQGDDPDLYMLLHSSDDFKNAVPELSVTQESHATRNDVYHDESKLVTLLAQYWTLVDRSEC